MNPDEHPHIASRELPAGPAESELLHICVRCSGELVHPLDWVDEGPAHYRMLLRCPDCEAIREDVFTQETIDGFADEIDRGEAVLLGALERVTRENMSEAIDFFVRALDADLIVPSDF